MNKAWRSICCLTLSLCLFLGAAWVAVPVSHSAQAPAVQHAPAAQQAPATQPASVSHPPPSAPEESATIADDPTIAPDPAESADNNVSLPTDI
jgi:hypothetical protein